MGLPFGKLAPAYFGGKNALLLPSALHAWVAGVWTTHDGGGGVTNVDSIRNLVQPAYPLLPVGGPTDLRTTLLANGRPGWLNFSNYALAAGIPGGALSRGSVLFVGQGNLATGGYIWSLASVLDLSFTAQMANDVGGAWARSYFAGASASYLGPSGNDFIELLTWDLTPAPGSRLIRAYMYSAVDGSKTFVNSASSASPPTLVNAIVGAGNSTISPGALCGSLQISNAFVQDADSASVFNRLKAAFGY